MSNDKNLQILLKDSPTIRLKENGEFLVFDLLIFSKAEFSEIIDLQIELIKYSTQNSVERVFKIESANAHNYIEAYKNVGMVLEFGLLDIHPIKTIVDRFKTDVYNMAKSFEVEINPEDKIADEIARKSFLDMKSSYVNEVLEQILLVPGQYSIKISLEYKTNSTMADAQFIFANFTVEDYLSNHRIGIDNLLGRIMSNILFAPSDPLEVIYPEYKTVNVLLK